MTHLFKVFFNALRKLSLQNALKLMRLTVSQPILAILSLYATARAFAIAKKYFPKTNSSGGIGNAFRHALWAGLIMMYCCKVSSPEKSRDFCEKITNLHEELFLNKPLETKMDLHNNRMGINCFFEMLPYIHRQFFETSFLVDVFLEKTKTAKIIKSLKDDFGEELVYL